LRADLSFFCSSRQGSSPACTRARACFDTDRFSLTLIARITASFERVLGRLDSWLFGYLFALMLASILSFGCFAPFDTAHFNELLIARMLAGRFDTRLENWMFAPLLASIATFAS